MLTVSIYNCFRKHTQSQGDNSLGAPPLTYSNLFYTGYGLSSGPRMHPFSDVMRPMQTADTSADGVGMGFPQGSLRSRNNTTIRLLSRNPSEIFLQGLREFISERHGVLEEGWSVEFKHSISNYDLYAVYCSPDGKTFHSMSEVACHLGLMPNRNSIDTDSTSYVSPSPQETLHLPRKSKSKRCSLTNVFSEHKTSLVSGYCKELFSNGQSIEINNANLGEVREFEMQEDGISDFQPSNVSTAAAMVIKIQSNLCSSKYCIFFVYLILVRATVPYVSFRKDFLSSLKTSLFFLWEKSM